MQRGLNGAEGPLSLWLESRCPASKYRRYLKPQTWRLTATARSGRLQYCGGLNLNIAVSVCIGAKRADKTSEDS